MKKYGFISFVVLFFIFVVAQEQDILLLFDEIAKEVCLQKDTPVLKRLSRKKKRSSKEPGKLGKKFLAFLTYFSNMFYHFINLLQRVNDGQSIQEPILGLFESMAQIVMEGIKNGELSPDATEQELQAYLEKVTKKIAPHFNGNEFCRKNFRI
jgi:hypothetical protein